MIHIRTRRITREEMEAIKKRLVKRDRIICDIMAQTGLRISDVLNLPKSLDSTKIYICEQKTGKPRTVHITQKLLDEIREYKRHERTEALFNVDESTIYRHITNAAKSLGYKNISAHSFRKLYAWEYAQKYGVMATQNEMNHENIATTMIYIYDVEM